MNRRKVGAVHHINGRMALKSFQRSLKLSLSSQAPDKRTLRSERAWYSPHSSTVPLCCSSCGSSGLRLALPLQRAQTVSLGGVHVVLTVDTQSAGAVGPWWST